jgi:Ca-activated chloride channel family protein
MPAITRIFVICLLPLLLVFSGTLGVRAQDTQPPITPPGAPPIPPWPPGVPPLIPPVIPPIFPPDPLPLAGPQVTVELHAVEAVVEGPVATVAVTQVFRNDSGQAAEGIYVFPLPADAAVSDFQLTVDGQTLEGKLLDRDEARRIYEQIVRARRDPALLEYIDRGLFQANVFPIPPGERRTLNFTYTQVLPQEDGLYRFNYPLRTRQLSSLAPERVTVAVELRQADGLRTIYSPDFPIRIDREAGDTSATVTFAAEGEQPLADFDLYFGTDTGAVGLNLLSYKPTDEDGYFALLAAPSVKAPTNAVVARDLVLVVDISGSMKGEKMEQARAAARYVVDALNPEDRFAVIAFSSASEAWTSELRRAGPEDQAAARAWIDDLRANGSTDINRALLEALALLDAEGEDATRPAYVIFLTDGQPTLGETVPERIVANAENNAPARTIRLFPFGIGYDVNTDLLDTLGSLLGGRTSYVQPEERIDEAVGEFYATISTPVLANIVLDFGPEVAVEGMFPYPLPDLFAGEQLVVVGRYAEGGPVAVTLRGEVNGEERLYVYEGRELAARGGEPFVARLWATRRIGALLDQVRRTGPDAELIDEIAELSLRYGIVTPYTSYLVLEPGEFAPAPLAEGSAAQAYAPRDIAADAHKGVAVAAAEAATAAPVGAAAVQGSEVRAQLQTANTVPQAEAVRFVAGRSFQRQGVVAGAEGQSVEFWVDTGFRADMAVTTVEFGSDAYFALLDEAESMAAWLAISPAIVIVTGDATAIRVTPAE